MLHGRRNGCNLPGQFAATLEHVQEKFLDFFDSDILQLFEIERRPLSIKWFHLIGTRSRRLMSKRCNLKGRTADG